MTPDDYLAAHARAAERDQECFRLETELAALRERLAEVEAERDRCHARLEIDHAFVLRNDDLERFEIPMDERASFPDAVDARDATIKLVEERAEAAEARVMQIRAETIEECAKIIEDHQEVTSLKTNKRTLMPRTDGNLVGFAYAGAIRALADANTGKGERG